MLRPGVHPPPTPPPKKGGREGMGYDDQTLAGVSDGQVKGDWLVGGRGGVGGSCTTSSDGLSNCVGKGGGGAQPCGVYEHKMCFVSLNLADLTWYAHIHGPLRDFSMLPQHHIVPCVDSFSATKLKTAEECGKCGLRANTVCGHVLKNQRFPSEDRTQTC